MLRTCLIILSCTITIFTTAAGAAETPPAVPARSPTPASHQDMEAIMVMADQGDANSQNYLGFLYATGQTVPKDEKLAFAWFRKAAAQGHPEAIGNLAMMYEKGLGVAKNFQTALSLHRQAAIAGNPVSMKHLAAIYETGSMGEERDPIKAEMWRNRHKETLKNNVTDTAIRQSEGKSPDASQPIKSAPAIFNAPVAPMLQATAVPAGTPPKPSAVAPPNALSSAAAKPYYFQISGKATARETLDVTQLIVEKNLLPQNKKIELVNPDGKSYRIQIGPFADAREAAPYKARITALLNPAPPAAKETQATVLPPSAVPANASQPAKTTMTPLVAAPPPALPAPTTKPIPTAPISAVQAHAAPVAAKPTLAAPAATATGGAVQTPMAPKPAAQSKTPPLYIEVSGKTTAHEATELIQQIVEKGLLPKNMQIELVNPQANHYRVRIGPFVNASSAALQTDKIKASVANTSSGPELVPAPAPKIPAPPAQKPASTASLVPPPQPVQPSTATPKPAPPPIAVEVAPAKTAIEKPATADQAPAIKVVRYYFIQLETKNTYEDSLSLAQFLFMKELVQETRRVKIENLDKSFRVSIGPYANAKEAELHLKKINQETFLKPSVVMLEKRIPASGEIEHELFVQLNAQGTLEQAFALTQSLLEKELLAAKMSAEVVNFGNGNYRARFGPFKDAKDAGQSLQKLKKESTASPILVNLDRLVPVEAK